MDWIRAALRDLWELHSGGVWCAVLFSVLAILFGLAAVVRRPKRRSLDTQQRQDFWFSNIAALSCISFLIISLIVITNARSALIHTILFAKKELDTSAPTRDLAGPITLQLVMLRYMGAAMALAGPFALLAPLLAWLRTRPEHRRLGLFIGGSMVGIWVVLSLALVGFVASFDINFHSGERKELVLQQMLGQMVARLMLVRSILLVACGAVGLVGIGMALMRRAPVVSDRALGATAILFALSAIVFGSTRGMAYDSRHPLPLDPSGGELLFPDPHFDTPRPEDCRPTNHAPVLRIAGGTIEFKNKPVMNTDQLREELRQAKSAWVSLHPAEPFPRTIIVLAARTASLSEIVPWLSAVQQAGYTHVLAGAFSTRIVPTRTLGPISLYKTCTVPIAEVEPARALVSAGTWNDFVQTSHW